MADEPEVKVYVGVREGYKATGYDVPCEGEAYFDGKKVRVCRGRMTRAYLILAKADKPPVVRAFNDGTEAAAFISAGRWFIRDGRGNLGVPFYYTPESLRIGDNIIDYRDHANNSEDFEFVRFNDDGSIERIPFGYPLGEENGATVADNQGEG